VTDDIEELERGRLRDRMHMSFGVVMDEPDKAITDEKSKVGKYDAGNRCDDVNGAESSMQLAQGSADRLVP
jgi:hypothetical protein